jgi:uncharacterized RmlC-like cupin family protein
MQQVFAPCPDYRAPESAPARRHAAEAARLWGGRLTPMMADADTRGRFAGAALPCPPTACTGSLEMDAGDRSLAWRNADAIENVVCVEGELELQFGQALEHSLTLGRFDMVSVPRAVRHRIVNAGASKARAVVVLSVAASESYAAVFDTQANNGQAEVHEALGVRFDGDAGAAVDAAELTARVTRFATLVPYKKDLNRTNGLPPEATESLSAGSVFPLIVPEGHIGRSRTAPMYGNQGLYISIAECSAGDDGPPPHAHSDTQESFFVLDGSFDICTGFDSESVVMAKPGDLVAMPNKVMRTFRNTSGAPARLLVIIQGPDRMNDTVSYSRRIGEDFQRRFGREVIDAYAQVRMTFDAEERAGA